MGVLEDLSRCTGFDWDAGNFLKNLEKHGVTAAECEQVFFGRPFVAAPDEMHSKEERRFYALGRTDGGRLLFVVFALRRDLIRVISARDRNRRERKVYLTP